MKNKKKSNIEESSKFSTELDEKPLTVVSEDETNLIKVIKPDKNTENIADIMETPNVSTWNKKIKGINGSRGKDVNTADEKILEKTGPLLTMGLKIENNDNEDKNEIFVDAANEKEVEKINNSGKTMTDKIYPFSKSKPLSNGIETNNGL